MKHFVSLSNTQIDNYYAGNGYYGGCYPKDELPDKIENKFYIINLDDSDGEGTHWTLIFNVNVPAVIYFDPFGVVPPMNAIRLMKTSRKRIYYSMLELQNIMSNLCGYYCLYFADQLQQNRYFLDITTQDFVNNTKINDGVIKKYFKYAKL